MKRTSEGEIIISKKSLLPLSLVITIIVAMLAGAGFVMGLDSRITINTAEIGYTQKELVLHETDLNIHQPFEDKLKTWYTRREGENLEKSIDSMNDKLDILLQRTAAAQKSGGTNK